MRGTFCNWTWRVSSAVRADDGMFHPPVDVASCSALHRVTGRATQVRRAEPEHVLSCMHQARNAFVLAPSHAYGYLTHGTAADECAGLSASLPSPARGLHLPGQQDPHLLPDGRPHVPKRGVDHQDRWAAGCSPCSALAS